MTIPKYMNSYVRLQPINTFDDKKIELVEINAPFDNEALLTSWAKSFRCKYISDEDLLEELDDTGIRNPIAYLESHTYPDKLSLRSGDFGEILVAEYLMFVEEFWVPTLSTRYSDKPTKEESTKGSDIIAIRFKDAPGKQSSEDLLSICEVKTGLSRSIRDRLQDAVNHSNKDDLQLAAGKRGSIALSAVKLKIKRLEKAGLQEKYSYKAIGRFENLVERPFRIQYIAAGVSDRRHFNIETMKKVETSGSSHIKSLRIVAFGVQDINRLEEALFSELGVANIGK